MSFIFVQTVSQMVEFVQLHKQRKTEKLLHTRMTIAELLLREVIVDCSRVHQIILHSEYYKNQNTTRNIQQFLFDSENGIPCITFTIPYMKQYERQMKKVVCLTDIDNLSIPKIVAYFVNELSSFQINSVEREIQISQLLKIGLTQADTLDETYCIYTLKAIATRLYSNKYLAQTLHVRKINDNYEQTLEKSLTDFRKFNEASNQVCLIPSTKIISMHIIFQQMKPSYSIFP